MSTSTEQSERKMAEILKDEKVFKEFEEFLSKKQSKKRERAAPKCSICGEEGHNRSKCPTPAGIDARRKKARKQLQKRHFGTLGVFPLHVQLSIIRELDAFSLVKLGIAFDGFQPYITIMQCIRRGGECSKLPLQDYARGCLCGKGTVSKKFQTFTDRLRNGMLCLCCGLPNKEDKEQKVTRHATPLLEALYGPDVAAKQIVRNALRQPVVGSNGKKVYKKNTDTWKYLRMHYECQRNMYPFRGVSVLMDFMVRPENVEKMPAELQNRIRETFPESRLPRLISVILSDASQMQFQNFDHKFNIRVDGTFVGYTLGGHLRLSKDFFFERVAPGWWECAIELQTKLPTF